MIIGYLLAALATLSSGSGSVLESAAVRRAKAFLGGASALTGLRRQPLYLLGLGVDLLGFALAALALRHLPLFLVQAMLAFSVGVTATISAVLGARLAATGWALLGLGAVGLGMLGIAAAPSTAAALPTAGVIGLLATPFLVAVAGSHAKRRAAPWSPHVLAFGAGVAFCAVGVSARTLAVPDTAWLLVLQPSLWALVLNGAVGAALFALALQHSAATTVTALMSTTNTALSALIGVLVLDDHVRPGFTAVAVIGFAAAVASAIGIARHTAAAPASAMTSDPRRPRLASHPG
ncbi:hypothetical protein V5P93_004164 [Actinokineospora auranticolor]|uniref:EamA-like transporter family protein n=1 Tax=Actinokineospora auranticolor TaxID=155976 RepID=A0A2S6GIT1_9PSEU|nr:hypothetical protein [Actinokineospora auranticolor]PPK65093.1 hypothetical protein CLV40_116136 [Actinokineospora auranticolor]